MNRRGLRKLTARRIIASTAERLEQMGFAMERTARRTQDLLSRAEQLSTAAGYYRRAWRIKKHLAETEERPSRRKR